MNTESEKGHLHPVTQVTREIYDIWKQMGFTLAHGPEIESEHYNFDTLNIPKDHPARDMWDTFWLKPLEARKLLRTHTSPVQVRYMEKNKPDTNKPLRIIAPGKVYRNEATDVTHEAQFYQLEGLMVGEDVSLADLKGTLKFFFEKFLKSDVDIRYRPSFFPFVEPGVEVDVLFNGRWIEIMGAGMIHPKVLEAAGIDPKKYKGFAFGAGIDRLIMSKFKIPDVRLLYTGDLRLINQF